MRNVTDFLSSGIAVLLFMTLACTEKAKPPPKPTLHKAFELAPLSYNNDTVTKGDWVRSTDVVPKPVITAVLVASWCPHCDNLVEKMRTDEDLRSTVDLVLVSAEEAKQALEMEVRHGNITSEEAKLYAEDFAERKQFVISHEFFGAEPSQTNIAFHVIRDDLFETLVAERGIPCAVRCTPAGCVSADRPDI